MRAECCGQVVLWMPHHSDGDRDEEYRKEKNKGWENVHTFGIEEGMGATEIATAIRLMAAAVQECGGELGMITCSTDVKQAFDNVSLVSFSLVMKEMDITPILAAAILREQIGGRYDICFPETRVSGTPFDKSINRRTGTLENGRMRTSEGKRE